ncbi:serine carboxypeptidase-like 28 [Rhodamnia argentea]|uniref:Serine carboxypeptidase-like 28 n=1 Tax=Rhodamnia argentea TaxID=178133 RepID=A0A8B8NG80_9MYRT|nr:serine carboxypeptidase-like 28 [Rhodamnia argentea]
MNSTMHGLLSLSVFVLILSPTAIAVDEEASSDRITKLPGQPELHVAQFSGYIPINREASLFYWLVEAAGDHEKKPLVLWLNGGPGCSSVGYGAMQELGPFRVSPSGETLVTNPYSWNWEANLLFLDSPAGVGFSFSTDNFTRYGDHSTAHESYTFLKSWFKRFPGYKGRAFYIAGQSYAGHYIPSLAQVILKKNSRKTNPVINLKGLLMGNPNLDRESELKGRALYYWSHGLISDDTYQGLSGALCSSLKTYRMEACKPYFITHLLEEAGNVNAFDVLRTDCEKNEVSKYCLEGITSKYMNRKDVQQAFHAIPTAWTLCSKPIQHNYSLPAKDQSMLPTLKLLIQSGLQIWIYSGDSDSAIPFIATQTAISKLHLKRNAKWYPWGHNNKISGWSEIYEGMTFATIRGCGHDVPMYTPAQALCLFEHFLANKQLPKYIM